MSQGADKGGQKVLVLVALQFASGFPYVQRSLAYFFARRLRAAIIVYVSTVDRVEPDGAELR